MTLLALALTAATLAGCGGDDDGTTAAEKAVDSVAGPSKAKLKGNSPLDAAAYAVVRVQSDKYRDYEIDGTTVRLLVRDGATLSGSECVIVSAATQADHPEASFVVVAPDGTETPC